MREDAQKERACGCQRVKRVRDFTTKGSLPSAAALIVFSETVWLQCVNLSLQSVRPLPQRARRKVKVSKPSALALSGS